jgi:F-type H+-transporting ATPase subunit alpha
MKKVAGTMKLDLAQFREMEAFSQFASDLDAATQKLIARGRRLTQLLKQGQFSPMTVAEQVIMIYAGTKGLLDDLPPEKINKFEKVLLTDLYAQKADLMASIEKEKNLTPEHETALTEFVNEAVIRFLRQET